MIYYLFINSVAYRVQVIFLSIFLFFLTTDASPQSVSLLSDEIIIFFKDVTTEIMLKRTVTQQQTKVWETI